MTTKIPPALQAYLAIPPDGSVIVLTSVVGTATNWLTLCYIQSFTQQARPPPSTYTASSLHPYTTGSRSRSTAEFPGGSVTSIPTSSTASAPRFSTTELTVDVPRVAPTRVSAIFAADFPTAAPIVPPVSFPVIAPKGASGSSTAGTARYSLAGYHSPQDPASIQASKNQDVSILLVSFMRDYAFWRDGASRLGVELDQLGQKGRFRFVDGLSYLNLPKNEVMATRFAVGQNSNLPWITMLTSHHYRDLRATLLSDLAFLHALDPFSKIVLVIDQLDLALAMFDKTTIDVARLERAMGLGLGLYDLSLELREKAHVTIMTFAVDPPLIQSPTTPLELNQRDLISWTAHAAELVICLTPLKTGAAKDVSGSLRISRGGTKSSRMLEETQFLYQLGGDGSVRVFEKVDEEPENT